MGRWEVQFLDTVDSTNRHLLDEAERGSPDGRVVVARHQTAGRGRRGRVWDSKPGSSLLFSILFRPSDGPGDDLQPFWYSQAVALATIDACALVAGFEARLKWPNDIVVGDRKLGGILGEAITTGDRVKALVIGCGLNLNWRVDMANTLISGAVSADELAGHELDLEVMLGEILRALDVRLSRPEWLMHAYRSRCSTLGRSVRIEQDDEIVEGTAVRVDDHGALVVREERTQCERAITLGDVVHLRSNE